MTPGRLLVVDGERFEVTPRAGRGQTYDYRWLSGPNPGYGFSSTVSLDRIAHNDGQPGPVARALLSDDDHAAQIRGFLAEIDPDTGYLAEID